MVGLDVISNNSRRRNALVQTKLAPGFPVELVTGLLTPPTQAIPSMPSFTLTLRSLDLGLFSVLNKRGGRKAA
jgi:hypothetical protein